MKTFTSVFSGFGLADKGLEQAGLIPINAFEIDPQLAEIGQANSTGKYVVGNICDVDWRRYERPDWLWASPVCKEFSQAKANGQESGIDVATAEATARAIRVWLPDVVFIENVWGYRKSLSFRLLCDCLTECGYWFQVHHLNAASFSVPQTRKRMIIRATRDGFLPPLPPPTPWLGWYQAIEDLIPDLPESRFAEWQLERMPEGICGPAFLMSNAKTEYSDGLREGDEPSLAVTTQSFGRTRAFIADVRNASRDATLRSADEPCFTMTSGMARHGLPRAFLVNRDSKCGVVEASEPAFTMVSQPNRNNPRAWLSQGRVVAMTHRALGRFQTLPDSFELSGKNSIDCVGIGNGVPCMMVRRLAEGFLQ